MDLVTKGALERLESLRERKEKDGETARLNGPQKTVLAAELAGIDLAIQTMRETKEDLVALGRTVDSDFAEAVEKDPDGMGRAIGSAMLLYLVNGGPLPAIFRVEGPRFYVTAAEWEEREIPIDSEIAEDAPEPDAQELARLLGLSHATRAVLVSNATKRIVELARDLEEKTKTAEELASECLDERIRSNARAGVADNLAAFCYRALPFLEASIATTGTTPFEDGGTVEDRVLFDEIEETLKSYAPLSEKGAPAAVEIDLVFSVDKDGDDEPPSWFFIEAERLDGSSVSIGEWLEVDPETETQRLRIRVPSYLVGTVAGEKDPELEEIREGENTGEKGNPTEEA
jgi:hypothetical protein